LDLVPQKSERESFGLMGLGSGCTYWRHLANKVECSTVAHKFLGDSADVIAPIGRVYRYCLLMKSSIHIGFFSHWLKVHADLCCLFLSCGMKVVSPCYRRWRNNLNEPLNPFPFLGGC